MGGANVQDLHLRNSCEIFTHHKPLVFLLMGNGLGMVSAHLVRLLSKLQEYDLIVKYVQGGKNVQANCLSRLPLASSTDSLDSSDRVCGGPS